MVVQIVFSDKLLTCGLREGTKAVLFLRVRTLGSSIAISYGHLKMSPLMRSRWLYWRWKFENQFFRHSSCSK